MLFRNLLFFFPLLIATVQAATASEKYIASLPTSIPFGLNGLKEIFRAFCEDITYTTDNIKEAVDLGCRRKNRKNAKLINPVIGLALRAPRIYKPNSREDIFEIPGNPYYMTALDNQRRKRRNTGGVDHAVMDENCSFVGIVTEYSSRFKKPKYSKCALELLSKIRPVKKPN